MTVLGEDRIDRLYGAIQHYAWGGYTFLPELLRRPTEPEVPYAEYWLGAHEKAPSQVERHDGTMIALDEVIHAHPEERLGSHVAHRYGRLPFLLKVMDVRDMLSIQVHPTKAEAEKGFARENAMGIPLDAPSRNYKDDNHKPELEVALSDFWLLYGFRPHEQLQAILTQIPELRDLQPIFANQGHAGLYQHVMEMPQESVNALLHPLAERVLQQYREGKLEMSEPAYWVAKTRAGLPGGGDYDRGIFSIYFFNLVGLKPGQATFQDAGIPHAYLHGQAIEIMANSDNVIRGGLTPKHIDVPELLRLVTCKGVLPEIIEGTSCDHGLEAYYQSPSPDFCLSRIVLGKGDGYENTASSLEILLLLCGEALLDRVDGQGQMVVQRGESAVVFAGSRYRLRTLSEHTVLYRASVPRVQHMG